MDPIDPAFLERSFDRTLPGSQRVERVRPIRDEQPAEEWDDDRGDRRQDARDPAQDEDVYEPSPAAVDPASELPEDDPHEPGAATDPRAGADWDGVDRRARARPDRDADSESVVVDLTHGTPPSDEGPGEDHDGPHIDISV